MGSLSVALLGAAALAAAPASAASDSAVSTNWAGYAVHRPGLAFTRISAAWTQPGASCVRGRPAYSAIWVGIGGFREHSNALEQIGTEVDCTRGGQVDSSAWYEIVPAPSEPANLKVRPGDPIFGAVTVHGNRVTLSLYNGRTHGRFQRTIRASHVDLSSAEWIVEAPSECTGTSSCQTLPLANFGSTTFGLASARNRRGHVGSISDRRWDLTRIRLAPSGRRFVGLGGSAAAGTAIPSGLSAGGSSFRVNFAWTTVNSRVFFGRMAGDQRTLPAPRPSALEQPGYRG